MKKNLLTRLLLPIVIMLVAGCQKDQKELIEKNNKEIFAARAENLGGCRLTIYDYYDGISDFHQLNKFSYKNGLCDELLAFYGTSFKMEYDVNRRLKISKVYDGGNLTATIHFIYKNNKVVNEIWYEGNTDNILDVVTNTYNERGEMIRNESRNNNYYVTYTHTANGDLESWLFYDGGNLVVKAEYTYQTPYKNSMGAIPGLEYSFVYANSGFGILSGKRWYSSEKITLYDENGEPFVYYEQDPAKTIWLPGQQGYPLNADYTDAISGLHINNAFEYENCIPGQVSRAAHINQNSFYKNDGHSKFLKPIFHGPSTNTIEKLKAVRLSKKVN
jgi:hypothetical protein